MYRRYFTAALAAPLITLATPATASVAITFADTDPIPGNNNFQGDLLALGLTQYAASGAMLTLSEDSIITFEFLGSESGYNDRFSAGSVTYTEYTTLVNLFGSPLALGSATFDAGSLASLLNFSAVGGAPATVGQDGFGILLGPNAFSGMTTNVFYLGYDDQINNQDDNHDDMVIRATVHSAVPEPATWAMMLIGFGVTGSTLRRRRSLRDLRAHLA